jgi:DHA1 family multidrug resistance protein-like MFS transporter
MWSIVQYKKIGRDVEREWQGHTSDKQSNSDGNRRKSRVQNSGQSDTTLRDSDLEQYAFSQSDEKINSIPENSTEDGKIIVELAGDNDPLDPHNWSLLKRAKSVTILCMLVFVQAWAGACESLDNAKSRRRHHVSPVVEDLSTAVYLFGIGSGCLFVGPLSQTLGRNPVYLSFSFTYLFLMLGTALSGDYASHVVCRYFAGLASSAALGINGASVGDMFRPVERALWFPVIAWVNVVRESESSTLS